MDVVEAVRQAVDIVTVIGESVPLKKRGRDYLGVCPFHSEKTPSFSVSPSKQLFYCFGCHAGGNVFTFVQKFYNWDFPQALEELARKAGIKIESHKSDPLWDEGLKILEVAGHYFCDTLASSKGEAFRDYLKSRKIPDQIVADFHLGAHPGDPQALAKLIKKKGFSEGLAAQLGVLGRTQSGDYVDRFRGRLMFPILDEKGRIRGFGGRSLGNEQPKYINSPKSSVFDKGRLFYGMHLAPSAIAKKGYVVLVEGYLDVMAMHEFGVTNTLGSMGTALTFEQIRLLKRMSPRVISLYDADRAGVAATEKNLGNFLREGVEPKVVVLPSGKDPDAFLHQAGQSPENLKTQLRGAFENSVLALDYLIRHTVMSEKTPLQRAKRVRDLIRILDEMPDEIERTLLKKDIAKRFDIAENLLFPHFPEDSQAPLGAQMTPHPQKAAKTEADDGRWEREILRFLVQNGEKGAFALTDLLPFLSSGAKWSQVLTKLAESALSSSDIAKLGWLQSDEPAFLEKGVRETVNQWVFEQDQDMNDEGRESLWNDLKRGLKRAYYQRYSQALQAQIHEAESENQTERLIQLLAEKRDLARMIKSISESEGFV